MTDNSQQPQDEADVEQQTFDFVEEEENPLEEPPEHHQCPTLRTGHRLEGISWSEGFFA